MSPAPVASVIVPAHEEEAVVGRCLAALLDGPAPLDVVVVVNGSTDGTAAAARAVPVPPQHRVRVLDLPEAGKVVALNAGDDAATTFPRLYVDADVVCDNAAAAAVVEALADPDVHAAAPRLRYDLSHSSWLVRAYSRVWTALHATPTLVGSGVYALDREGRERFGRFPPLIADDAFVQSRFAAHERRAVEPPFTAFPPRGVADLVRRKTRAVIGLRELQRSEPVAFDTNASRLAMLHPSRGPGLVSVAVYVVVTVVAKVRASWRERRGLGHVWERDESSRSAGRDDLRT